MSVENCWPRMGDASSEEIDTVLTIVGLGICHETLSPVKGSLPSSTRRENKDVERQG